MFSPGNAHTLGHGRGGGFKKKLKSSSRGTAKCFGPRAAALSAACKWGGRDPGGAGGDVVAGGAGEGLSPWLTEGERGGSSHLLTSLIHEVFYPKASNEKRAGFGEGN